VGRVGQPQRGEVPPVHDGVQPHELCSSGKEVPLVLADGRFARPSRGVLGTRQGERLTVVIVCVQRTSSPIYSHLACQVHGHAASRQPNQR